MGYSIGCAGVAELVDAPDLGSGAVRRGGSSPFTRTKAFSCYENAGSKRLKQKPVAKIAPYAGCRNYGCPVLPNTNDPDTSGLMKEEKCR